MQSATIYLKWGNQIKKYLKEMHCKEEIYEELIISIST